MINKKTQTLVIVILLLILSACGSEQQDLFSFTEIDSLEYEEEIDFCQLVERVDEYEKKDFTYTDDKRIKLPNKEIVHCDYENTEYDLGTYKIAYRYLNDVEYLMLDIVDTIKPTIQAKDKYEVELGNEYFDLDNLIDVKDNHSKDLEVFYLGEYDLNKSGIYKLEVKTLDESGNETIKNIEIDVKPKNEIEKEVIVYKDSNNANNQNSNNNSQQQAPQQPSQPKPQQQAPQQQAPVSNYKPSSATFLIDSYNSFDECLNACSNHLSSEMAKGYIGQAECQVVKEKGINKGYRAVFK